MSIRWITPLLGTAPASQVSKEPDINIIDVRDLVDKSGNRADTVLKKITEGCDSLREGKKTVICCDYGISRSNAVAAGVLARHESVPFETAVRQVLEATGERDIKVGPLQSVRMALGETGNKAQRMEKHVLVTGGTGFLGMPVSKKLGDEFTVVAPNSNELDLLPGGSQLDLVVGEKEIDCIVHLANPRTYTTNLAVGETLTMLRNVLDVCVARDIKLIYLSSSEVYSGYRSAYLKADESLPLHPKGPYAETKYLCELLIEHSRRCQGLRCTILRSSLVYGVGGDRPRFIYNFMEKIEQSRRIVTHRYNNGLPSLDLLYMDDLVAAVAKAIGNDFSGNLNIGTGVVTSTRKIAEILRDCLGGQNEIDATLIDGDTAGIEMVSDMAKAELGWQATIGIDQGLQLVSSNLSTRKV